MSEAHRLCRDLGEGIKTLIERALHTRYISTSSIGNCLTGNGYQTVVMDGEELAHGYRADRTKLFDRFDFAGRHVLDCGSNIGEISRLARSRGAALVDGVEYDPYFVQIANLINAYKGTTRVSFRQGDISQFEIEPHKYDTTLAFSVFPYVRKVLPKIAEITGEALLLETHDLKPTLWSTYIEPIKPLFPYNTFVEFTDFGSGEGKRAVILFTKRRQDLLPGLLRSSSIDLSRSRLCYTDRMLALAEGFTPEARRDHNLMGALLEKAGPDLSDGQTLLSGCKYWCEMIRGYLEYRRQDRLSDTNPYLVYLKDAIVRYDFDWQLKVAANSQDHLKERIVRRFGDIGKLAGSSTVGQIEPVEIINPSEGASKFTVFHLEAQVELRSDSIDGYHRLFWAAFFGLPTVPALFVYR